MHHYEIFGGVLGSELAFPELPPADVGEISWEFRIGEPPLPNLGALLGEDRVYGDFRVRAYVTPGGRVLQYDDTGTFATSQGGRVLTWFPPAGDAGSRLEAVRADVIGRLLALALHEQNVLSLHASGVAVHGVGVALLAPKLHGKSTLATALLRAGGRLLTDDTLPVETGLTEVVARPGVRQLRLWRDSAATLGLDSSTATSTRKVIVGEFAEGQVERSRVPFAAAYVLVPVTPESQPAAAERDLLPSVHGALALIEHSKLGPLLGGAEAPRVFQQATAIATTVPVYRLRVARDLARVDEAARTIVAWHAPAIVAPRT